MRLLCSHVVFRMFVVFLMVVTSAAVATTAMADQSTPDVDGGAVTTIASGLTNPRGIAWSSDGTMYLAEGGSGGATHIEAADGITIDIGLTSTINTVANGCATPVVPGLASMYWEEVNWTWGAMDVAFLNGQLYILAGGAGPFNGSPNAVSGILRVNDDGAISLVADLGAWTAQHTPALTAPDYSPGGSWFDMEAAGDSLVVADAVGGWVLRVTPDGDISEIADLSEDHLVPSGLAVDDDGNIFVGFETAAPYVDGSSKVEEIAPDGTISNVWTGLTAVTDVALGPDGALYAAEMATGNTEEAPFLSPNSGRIVKQTGPDSLEAVVIDVPYPVNIGFDGSGQLVFDAPAFGDNRGEELGYVVAVDMNEGPVSLAGFEPEATCN